MSLERSAREQPGGKAKAAPPHPYDNRWHVHVDGQTYGPYSGHQVREMVAQNQIAKSDFVYREDGSAWVQITNDPVLGALFKTSEPLRSPLTTRGASFSSRRWLLVIPIVALAIGWIIWPYYAAYSLAKAFRDGDVAALESRVAWDSVRQGLRSQLNAMLLQKVNADAKAGSDSAFGTGLAVMLGPVMVDRMVDSYVTPHAIAAAIRADGKDKAAPSSATESNKVDDTLQKARDIRWDQIKYAFFSGGPLTFLIELVPDGSLKGPIQAYLEWGGTWKLTRVTLPLDGIDAVADSLKDQKASGAVASKQSSAKPAVKESRPQPITVSLVSKGFKASNARAGDYEDEINIELLFTNAVGKDIRAFDGVLTFTDLLDNKVFVSKIAINDAVQAGAVKNWRGSIKYNQFMEDHRNLRNEAKENLKISFSTRKVLYADGISEEYRD